MIRCVRLWMGADDDSHFEEGMIDLSGGERGDVKSDAVATTAQRVQIIKPDKDKGGYLEFGTELVTASDRSLVALLGASPGASTASVPKLANL